jgi:hypothetical protein
MIQKESFETSSINADREQGGSTYRLNLSRFQSNMRLRFFMDIYPEMAVSMKNDNDGWQAVSAEPFCWVFPTLRSEYTALLQASMRVGQNAKV